MCRFSNIFNDEMCHNCGKSFSKIPGYFESPLIDIEISNSSLRIYYKKSSKPGSTQKKFDHVNEYEKSKITDLSLIIQRKGPYLNFNYENKIISVKVSFEQSKGIEKFLKIPQNYAVCPDDNCSYDLNLNHDENCPECGKACQVVSKEVFDKLLNDKKTKKMESEIRLETKKRVKEREKKRAGNIVNKSIGNVTGPTRIFKSSNIDYSIKQEQFRREAHTADLLYKSYVTGGVSRLDKVNGRFLAIQTFKLDVLIEQNNRIIELLEITANENSQKNSEIIKLLEIMANQTDDSTLNKNKCPKCGTKNLPDAKKCQKCGTDIKKSY